MNYVEVIKKMPSLHCARGPKRCEKCKELLEEGDKYALIRVYIRPGDIARPMTEIYMGGERVFKEYDVMLWFESKEEARDYAIKNGLGLLI